MADAGGQKILVIAGVAQQEQAGVFDQTGVGTEVEIEIAAHPAARIDADGTVEILGRVPGVFQRFPGHLQELAVLRVENGGLFRREAEEIGVEIGETVERGGGGDVIVFRHPRRAFTGGNQLRLGQHPNAFDPARKILPKSRNIPGTGQMRRHADNRNVGFGQIFQQRHGNRHSTILFARHPVCPRPPHLAVLGTPTTPQKLAQCARWRYPGCHPAGIISPAETMSY